MTRELLPNKILLPNINLRSVCSDYAASHERVCAAAAAPEELLMAALLAPSAATKRSNAAIGQSEVDTPHKDGSAGDEDSPTKRQRSEPSRAATATG